MCASSENVTTTTTNTDNENANDTNGNATTLATGTENVTVSDSLPIPAITSQEEILRDYGPNFKILVCNPQVHELLTIIRDK